MNKRIRSGGLSIDPFLYNLVGNEIAPGTGVHSNKFWSALASIVSDLEPVNRKLLEARDTFQKRIDAFHLSHKGRNIDREEYRTFLIEIGYLLPEGDPFQIATKNVDDEISRIAGPQLVVPLDNARYSLNASNARWGSLYNALYGTNVIGEDNGAHRGADYNPVRGARVVAEAELFLDAAVPLSGGSYSTVTDFALNDKGGRTNLTAHLRNGSLTQLDDPVQFVGFRVSDGALISVLLRNHAIHIEIQIDRAHPIGKTHPAGVKDVFLESAITTIQDCEDSVSAVDAADKVRVYRNWNGLMKGDLETDFQKGGRMIHRRLHPDRTYTSPEGEEITLSGRSLLLVRNVGIHMHTDSVITESGGAIPEGYLDAMVTSLAAMHDLKGDSRYTNSRKGSIYIVKPKLHGPDEARATAGLFDRVEDALGLDRNTLKIGIMDEERRTTVNLLEAIRAVRERIVFINTGFLDRTGDEIHTSFEAGPMLPKMEIKEQPWMLAYEDWNVDIGLNTGLQGKAQIGKGMWTIPDDMKTMMETKGAHPQSGATTAWVPSPTAATLHAMHYHKVNVARVQQDLHARARARLDDILTLPLLDRDLTGDAMAVELENNAQGILGYVVRWVDQGVGCSKVPDIRNVGLMEDRATLRISSQHIANWLHHRLITENDIRNTFARMAAIVDRQNEGDPNYRNMAPDLESSPAYQAALDLVLKGREQPNGYTEFILHPRRREAKRQEVFG